jgi:hypothetical protein
MFDISSIYLKVKFFHCRIIHIDSKNKHSDNAVFIVISRILIKFSKNQENGNQLSVVKTGGPSG